MSAAIPQSYTQWRRCIEIDCGLTLTPEFVAARIDALSHPGSEEASRFARLYGEPHLQRVVGWFHTAATSLHPTD